MSISKKQLIVICIIVSLILLVPEPVFYSDGGTVEYNAILYSVKNKHSLWSEDGSHGYIVGIQISILGKMVYDNTRFEANN